MEKLKHFKELKNNNKKKNKTRQNIKQETTEKTIGSIEGTSAIVLCGMDKKDRIET